MPPGPVHAVTLVCHPETPSDAVHGISARVCRKPGSSLAVSYVIEGDLDRMRVPAPRAPGIAGRLWQHTCCELFIGCKGMQAYHEFNFSPSGEWAAYAFGSYRALRNDESTSAAPAPHVTVRAMPGKLELDALIRLGGLPALPAGSALSLGISAVTENDQGALAYWALRHPPGKPDFHHAAAFALELEA
jgi:hypothetical protein